MKTPVTRISSHPLLVGLVLLMLAGSALACQVPVFRYALERWRADQYRILVLSEGELSESSLAAFKPLEGTPEFPAQASIKVHDVSKTSDEFVRHLWITHRQGAGPVMIALYPQKSSIDSGQVAYSCPLTEQSVQQVVDSPARKEILGKLAEGHSAVWIFLESGDAEKDRAALKTLEGQLVKDAVTLKLPAPEEMEIKPEQLASIKIKLQIQFSVVSVKKDDPKETFLIECLLNSESDLRDFAEPMAFPVFGRGRVLYALVGQGIAAETIREASEFIVGPCSCQVKEQNPGFDLLLPCDWESLVGNTFISDPIPGTDSEPKLLTIPAGRSKK